MGSRKALKFFSSQCRWDEHPTLHLILQLRIPVVSLQVGPTLDFFGGALHTQHQTWDSSSLLLHPPVASFQAVQATHFPGLSIIPVCVTLALLFVIQG